MYSVDQNYDPTTISPLYPTDHYQPIYPPCHPPTYPHMPSCPMMDPNFRDCVKVCMMMRCGNHHKPMESSMYMDYQYNFTEEPNGFNPY